MASCPHGNPTPTLCTICSGEADLLARIARENAIPGTLPFIPDGFSGTNLVSRIMNEYQRGLNEKFNLDNNLLDPLDHLD